MRKHAIAHELVSARGICISVQVINEVSVNLLKKTDFTETALCQLVHAFYTRCHVVPLDAGVFIGASELRRRYSLSYWDSIIAACALSANCDTLLCEDMQHGLVINGRLTVNNPFSQ